jgi:uncharacterized protein (TIGR02594 family)
LTNSTPEWLLVMRTLTGTVEAPGASDNPKIISMAAEIGKRFPEHANYAALYVHDSIPWCGLCAAYCMAMCDPPIEPPFGSTDTQRWMWARAWGTDPNFIELDVPQPGCVVVLTRTGGGHVTFYERTEGNYLVCRGGNQSDSVNTAKYKRSDVVALMWPRTTGEPLPVPEPAERRELSKGDTGQDVIIVQSALGIPADGDFGDITEAAVLAYQKAVGIGADGVVGPETWQKIDDLIARVAAGSSGLAPELEDAIIKLAKASPVMNFSWPDRSKAPPGYIPGMCLCFALAATLYEEGAAIGLALAQADKGEAATDALTWYRSQLLEHEMNCDKPGIDTLRHLFVLLIGLGMRESSGRYCEGRDMSATNVSADTCEAGLFQMSWNMRTASPLMLTLLEDYVTDPNGFLPTFQEKVSPSANEIASYGTGQGATYQWLAKYSPAFAAMTTAVGLRTRRQHWGPINRREVDIVPAVNSLLLQVQELLGEPPVPTPEPEPEPDIAEVSITIESQGKVRVLVNDIVVSIT